MIYYFGCIGSPGHYLWEKIDDDTVGSPRPPPRTPWGLDVNFDARLAAGAWREPGEPKARMEGAQQPEGQARLYHRGGWTALAFWDRSVDKRENSNSVFFADEALDFEPMLTACRETWPMVFERFTFEVREARA